MDYNPSYRTPSFLAPSNSPLRRGNTARSTPPSLTTGDDDEEYFSSRTRSSKHCLFTKTPENNDPFYNEVEELVYQPRKEMLTPQKESFLRSRPTQGLNLLSNPTTPIISSQSNSKYDSNDNSNDNSNNTSNRSTSMASVNNESTQVSDQAIAAGAVLHFFRPLLFTLFITYWLVREPFVRCTALIFLLVSTIIADPLFVLWEALFSKYYVPTARYRVYFTRACTTFVCLLAGLVAFKYIYDLSWEQLEDFGVSLRDIGQFEQKRTAEISHIRQQLFEQMKLEKLKLIEQLEHGNQQLMKKLDQKVTAQLEEALYHTEERFDFASLHYGAQVVHPLTSDTFETRRAIKRWIAQLNSHPPESALDHSLEPGNCWLMVGSSGQLAIRLLKNIVVTSVTIGHPSPEKLLHRESMPKQMQLFGYKPDNGKEVLIGNIVYDVRKKQTLQTFHFDNSLAFRTVILKVVSNYGHDRYTEVYSVRVHGKVQHSNQ